MAYAFQVPRQRPLTQGAQIAEDQNTRGLATGQYADVQSAAGATDRANALRTSNALQATRGTFARSGQDFSPEAAARAQDQSFSAAEGQNLNGTNAVNQLQRQYRNDAMTNANQYESAANQRQQQGVSNDQFQQTFGANREDAATARNQFGQNYNAGREDAATARNQFGLNYNAGREDANTSKNQFGETMAQRKNEFGVSSGQSQQQIDNQSKQFLTSQAQRDKEFGVTSGQSQQQINNQVDQYGRSLNQNQNQFDLSRGDSNSQFDKNLGQRQSEFGVTSGQNQQQINNQTSQFNQNYAAGREDANTSKSQFDLTRGDKNSQFNQTLGQNQQQIDNQASQAAAKMGYDYASLSQNDKQFFADKAMKESQFGVTSGQNQQQINNQASQFGQNYQAGREDAATSKNQFDLTRGDKNSQFDVTSGQNQQQINNQAGQFNQTLNQNASQFNDKLGQDANQFAQNYEAGRADATTSKSQFDLTRGDKQKSMTMDEINTIQDPVARNQALKAYYSGGNVGDTISGNIDANGQLINHASSPAEVKLSSAVDELKNVVPRFTIANGDGYEEPQDQYAARLDKLARDKIGKDSAVTNGVTDTGVKSLAVSKAKDVLTTSPQSLTPDQKETLVASGDIKHYNTVSSVPIGQDAKAMTGQQVKVGNDFYTVLDGGSVITKWNGYGYDNNHKGYTTLTDGSGKSVYVVDGILTKNRPQDARKPLMFGL